MTNQNSSHSSILGGSVNNIVDGSNNVITGGNQNTLYGEIDEKLKERDFAA